MIYFLNNIKHGYGKFMDILNNFEKYFLQIIHRTFTIKFSVYFVIYLWRICDKFILKLKIIFLINIAKDLWWICDNFIRK